MNSLDKEQAEEILRTALNDPNATFREGQWECIEAILQRKRLLVVQRTGWGKSMVYFIATRLLRDQGAGPTLMISPLRSLMRDQIRAARNLELRAEYYTGENATEHDTIAADLHQGSIDIVAIAPEQLAIDKFRKRVLGPIAEKIGLLVVDEAHCISDWGHDFRPDYRRISRILQFMPLNLPVLATTATASTRVVHDIVEQIGDLEVSRGPLTRKGLKLYNINLPSATERLAWLAHVIPKLDGSGIIYTLTTRDAERVAEYLQSKGIDARFYHSQMKSDPEQPGKADLEEMLRENKIKALVATVSLGMGFDKPDLTFVIHYQRPSSVVHYYQQVGRAGRAVDSAFGVLLGGVEDDRISNYFIEHAFPPQVDVDTILAALEKSHNGLTEKELLQNLNISRSRLTKALRYLHSEEQSPIDKDDTKWRRLPIAWKANQERINALTQLRQQEQEEMAAYLRSEDCLMWMLSKSLDDPYAEKCGICMNCTHYTTKEVSSEAVKDAEEFLRTRTHTFEPRKQWPSPMAFPLYEFKGNIADQDRASEGRALCLWGDPVWGPLISKGKYEDGRFDDALVAACVDLLRRSPFHISPSWVTSVPSGNRPTLVSDFARRLAKTLGLPYSPAVSVAKEHPAQKEMLNSWQQAHNLDGAFRIDRAALLPGAVLLVDDIVDSKWTMTVIAACLLQVARKEGFECPAVLPLALALNTLKED